jgi:hypothetical protein
LEAAGGIARKVIESLGIASSIRGVLTEETDSPWNEKALIKRKGAHLDVKITVWRNDAFLYGRVFRLFLYISDVLDPGFRYDPGIAPDEDKEPEATARYNQIWSLYVDSRMERRGIENFFDRATRKNLFIDMEKHASWAEAGALFLKLWAKASFTYPEIVDLSRNLPLPGPWELKGPVTPSEVEINARIASPHVLQHIERMDSASHRETVNEILSFTAYHCKDCYITSSYYGIFFLYERRVFVEICPAPGDLLYFTLINPASKEYETEALTGPVNLTGLQARIKKTYDLLAAQSGNM